MLLSGEEVSPEDKQADWWGWIKFWVRPIAKLQFVNQLRSVLGAKQSDKSRPLSCMPATPGVV